MSENKGDLAEVLQEYCKVWNRSTNVDEIRSMTEDQKQNLIADLHEYAWNYRRKQIYEEELAAELERYSKRWYVRLRRWISCRVNGDYNDK